MGIITVSRLHGSGGTLFARQIAKRLDYTFVNRTIINNDSRDNEGMFGIHTKPGMHDMLMSEPNFYKVSLIESILDRALKNNVVLAGMGAGIVLADMPNTINIRIVRLLAERVREISRAKNIGYDDAFDLVEKMDDGKRNFILNYFDADVADPSNYHAVINSSFVSLDDAVDIAASYAYNHLTPSHAPGTEVILKNRLLEKRAEMLLFHLEMGHCYDKVIFEASAGGILKVAGIVRNEAEKERLIRALKENNDIGHIEDFLETGIIHQGL
ncbi:MAG: cytidylate kinase-like family protein [Syntrophorhabdaceae bacterium]